MKLQLALALAVLGTVIFLTTVSISQPSDQASAAPILKSLEAAVAKMGGDLNGLPAAEKNQADKLVSQEKAQLATANSQCGGGLVSTRQLNVCLAPFFETGARLIDVLKKSGAGKLRTMEYSPDPSYCANHCVQSCGYNSIGEKVCFYRCYQCCGRGGC